MENKPASIVSLSVSIVLYHSSVELLLSTIRSLYKAALRALHEGQLESVSVMLIDNSENQNYRTAVCQILSTLEHDDFFALKYVATMNNRGYGAGHNLGLPAVASDYHLILNPDVGIAESALATGLLALKNDVSLTLISPLVLGTAGEQEFLCKSYPSLLVLFLRALTPAFIHGYFETRLDRYEMREACTGNQAKEVLLASGCFMLLRTAAFVEVGGFNEKYFLYFEDFDLSIRLGGKGRLVFYPAMEITHHGGYAASKGFRHIWLFIKSGTRFFNDHGWKWI